ncbi:MAG: CocE/NonD family hydrolase C-terminal non-catalytic domain-containing protein [Nocardioides sp.]
MSDPQGPDAAAARLGAELDVRIPLTDGTELATTLFLPVTDVPVPCLLEALPYRKDDLTASYADSYRALRDRHGYAVGAWTCAAPARPAGSRSTSTRPRAARPGDRPAVAGRAGVVHGGGRDVRNLLLRFQLLQLACERPPALRAICAIYATDDRWTDDVHWRGGALRLVDLVDYCHYMTAMNVLPPVPAVWGDGWEAGWQRRLDTHEPWVLTWLRENRHGDYWNHGSVRLDGGTVGYDRIACPTMIVAGWADGYRNNSFRTAARLAEAGVPHRLLAGPWAHADPLTAMPGPRLDLDVEMVAWFDRWLRPSGDEPAHADHADVFVRSSTRPAPDLDLHEGWWLRLPPVPPTTPHRLALAGPRSLRVAPDVGTAAWIDCAGHLPWGLSGDQRLDDARSLTWDLAPPDRPVVGHPVARLRVTADRPLASLSVKLCDVFPDGTSALVSRGTLDLAYRDGVHGPPKPLVPGEAHLVDVELDACAYAWSPGQTLRLSVAGADWPNTVAPPGPVTLTVEGTVELPLLEGNDWPAPAFTPGAEHSTESAEGVTWEVRDEVLARPTTAVTRQVSDYPTPYDGRAREAYLGEVSVHRDTFAQRARADTTFDLAWPEASVQVRSVMEVEVGPDGYDVAIETVAERDGVEVSRRSWREHLPR